MPAVWLNGDLHIENFGTYRGDNRLVYFDIGDFDDGALGPLGRDLMRFLVGVHMAGHEMGFFTELLFVDDETLACGATAGLVLFYRVADGALVRRERVHHEAPVVSLALEPSQQAIWVALGTGGGTLVRVPR